MDIRRSSALSMMNADKQIWYKEPWPWFLMGLPLAAVVAGIATLIVAVRSDDGLVIDEYYKQGLGINKLLARQEMASKMGLEATVSMFDNKLSVTLKGDVGVVLPERIQLVLSRPTRAGEDTGLALNRVADGRYEGALKSPSLGHWNVLVEDSVESWRMSGSVVVPLKAPVVIRPVIAGSVE